jgi:hypothetical protein
MKRTRREVVVDYFETYPQFPGGTVAEYEHFSHAGRSLDYLFILLVCISFTSTMKWSDHVARTAEQRRAYKALVGKHKRTIS